jgi:hypothetical protein
MGRRALGVAIALAVGTVHVSAQHGAPPRPSAAGVASGFIGVVVDSIHGGPLVGAVVGVAGTERRAISDARGRFRVDSVPPGAYRLTLSHPLFDTLGFSLATQQIPVAARHYVVVALATPSARTLRRQLCPQADTIATPSFIMGRVRDADSHVPVAGAHISLVFSTTAVTLADGVRHVMRVRRATTAPDGTYVICGLESDVHGTLQAERAGVTTAEVETSLGGKVIALRSLSAGSGEVGATPTLRTSAADSLRGSGGAGVGGNAPLATGGLLSGQASVAGVVLDSSGSPLPGAIVAVTSTAAVTRTGSRGEFSLTGLPSGTQELAVRNVGFAPVALPVELTVRQTRSVTVRLHRATASLAPVVVSSKTDAALARLGFFDRQKVGVGHFITPAEVKQAQPHAVTDLMYLVPGADQLLGTHGAIAASIGLRRRRVGVSQRVRRPDAADLACARRVRFGGRGAGRGRAGGVHGSHPADGVRHRRAVVPDHRGLDSRARGRTIGWMPPCEGRRGACPDGSGAHVR